MSLQGSTQLYLRGTVPLNTKQYGKINIDYENFSDLKRILGNLSQESDAALQSLKCKEIKICTALLNEIADQEITCLLNRLSEVPHPHLKALEIRDGKDRADLLEKVVDNVDLRILQATGSCVEDASELLQKLAKKSVLKALVIEAQKFSSDSALAMLEANPELKILGLIGQAIGDEFEVDFIIQLEKLKRLESLALRGCIRNGTSVICKAASHSTLKVVTLDVESFSTKVVAKALSTNTSLEKFTLLCDNQAAEAKAITKLMQLKIEHEAAERDESNNGYEGTFQNELLPIFEHLGTCIEHLAIDVQDSYAGKGVGKLIKKLPNLKTLEVHQKVKEGADILNHLTDAANLESLSFSSTHFRPKAATFTALKDTQLKELKFSCEKHPKIAECISRLITKKGYEGPCDDGLVQVLEKLEGHVHVLSFDFSQTDDKMKEAPEINGEFVPPYITRRIKKLMNHQERVKPNKRKRREVLQGFGTIRGTANGQVPKEPDSPFGTGKRRRLEKKPSTEKVKEPTNYFAKGIATIRKSKTRELHEEPEALQEEEKPFMPLQSFLDKLPAFENLKTIGFVGDVDENTLFISQKEVIALKRKDMTFDYSQANIPDRHKVMLKQKYDAQKYVTPIWE